MFDCKNETFENYIIHFINSVTYFGITFSVCLSHGQFVFSFCNYFLDLFDLFDDLFLKLRFCKIVSYSFRNDDTENFVCNVTCKVVDTETSPT